MLDGSRRAPLLPEPKQAARQHDDEDDRSVGEVPEEERDGRLEEAVAAIFRTPSHAAHRRFWVSALLPYLFMLLLMVALFFITQLTATLDVLGEHPLRAGTADANRAL